MAKETLSRKMKIEFGIACSLSARVLHRAPPHPAPSRPKFSNSENCCGSENAMPPKIFWDMEGHRGNPRSKNVFFFQKNIFWKKKHNKSHYFLIFRYAFCRYTNTVILKKTKISPKMCLYVPEKQP